MAELIVVGFKKDMYRASYVVNRLQEMNEDWVVDLHDAVAVYRDYNGKLRVDQSYQMTTKEGAAWGGLLGLLLGALIAVPFTAGVSGAVAAGTIASGGLIGGTLGAGTGALNAAWWKDEYGIPEDFVRDVQGMIQPGDSAVFVILRTANPEYVAEQFRGYGGTVLRTTLTPEQIARVEHALKA